MKNNTFQRFFGSNTAKCSFLRNGYKSSLWGKAGSEEHELVEREGQEEEDAIEGGAENST